jgi:hypothetical protein
MRYLPVLRVHKYLPPTMERCGKLPWRNVLMMISQIYLVTSFLLSDVLHR